MRARLAAITLALLVASASVFAAYTKFEAVTIPAASTGFTSANINNLTGIHPPATQATCRLELAEIRYTIDGSTPSASAGVLLEVGDQLTLFGNDTLNTFRGFRTGGTSGQLDCHYSGAF